MKYINKILAIAISEYEEPVLNQISNCYSDVVSLVTVLNERYQFDDTEIIFERKDTTRKNLFRRLAEYLKNASEDESVLMIFAGHGQYDPSLGTAYWQPSDSDSEDPTSWIDVSQILALLKVSKAHHISIISDSCFSGAMFRAAERGGGMTALENRRSREAVTSGHLETVSDGIKGEMSPFTKTILDILQKNESKELPFNVFAVKATVEFDQSRKQTPTYGSLSNVGHDGGTFIFRLKEDQQPTAITDKGAFLRRRLQNIYLPLPQDVLSQLDDLGRLRTEKNTVVRAQRFEEAARLRDQEKQLEAQVAIQLDKQLAILSTVIQPDNKDASEIEKELIEYNVFQERMVQKLKESQTGSIQYSDLTSEDFELLLRYRVSPVTKWLEKHKTELLAKFNGGISGLFDHVSKKLAGINHEHVSILLDSLKTIMKETMGLEIDLLIGRVSNELDQAIRIREVELKYLKWLKGVDLKNSNVEASISIR